tara:strand:- start:1036 stop:3096 length:2061 start_codon:yes stop_codon:yes gene_type:complete
VQVIQLYIEDNPIELFKDESISITDSIKSVKDIAKVFTAFTKTFTVPASKNNNKIFKHYYNFDIIDGFDARTKKAANIELNNLPFKKGKIKLEGVQMKGNKPYAYKITFFGETVDLKDLVGEDKLNQLTSLNSLSLNYDASTLKTKLLADPASNNIITPLITHTDRLFYNSNSGAQVAGSANLFPNSGVTQGVLFSELKYAVRVNSIIDAIEIKYGISFSDDFFVSSNAPYYNLFMWLHRKKGDVESGTGLAFTNLVNGWSNATGTVSSIINTDTLRLDGATGKTISSVSVQLNRSETHAYDISIQRNGQTIINQSGVTGTSQGFAVDASLITVGAEFTVTLSYGQTSNFTSIIWSVAYIDEGLGGTDTFNTSTYQASGDFEFVITSQLPEIKVIDFLTGIFKMFNLTAFVEERNLGLGVGNVIVVQTLDDFYSTYNTYDISKYVDTETANVNVALPYKEIVFKYEDTDTFLAATHEQLFNYQWAAEDYKQTDDDGNNLDGGIYTVKAPFGHLKYERLLDADDGSSTNVQVGYNVDDNQEPYIGKPVLFYPIRLTSSTTPASTSIQFRDDSTNQSTITSYNLPSNSVALDTSTSTNNINFKNEFNEFTATTGFTNTLFQAYYSNYITSVFNQKNRLTKVKAFLPIRILRSLTLADRIVINNKQYKINSIKTNLLKGESDIELLNDL